MNSVLTKIQKIWRNKMKVTSIIMVLFLIVVLPCAVSAQDGSLRILLTNDDGYQAPGIQTLYAALTSAGHQVIMVAPLENQSSTGGASYADPGEFVDVIQQAPGIWSVDSTPSDAVRVGLDLFFTDNPPDLIISGMNFGQNLGQPASNASGTIGAALVGTYKNVPAIAVSVGILVDEMDSTPVPFPSTFAAFTPAANFIVNLIEQLKQTAHNGQLLPPRVMLNLNFPVPYDQINGVKITKLGQLTMADLVFQDIMGVIPNGGGPVLVNFQLPQGQDPVSRSDFNAHQEGYISISILDGDMTARTSTFNRLKHRLFKIQPN
jgi:5'/3'-nucleotidase SurE